MFVKTETMESIAIRYADKFPEPQFASLQNDVFSDIQQYSSELAAIIDAEQRGAAVRTSDASAVFRLGAYDGDELVGWTYGWMEKNAIFYMANSGVLPAYRRRGIYTSLLHAIRAHAVAQGACCIRSRHAILNNPVIIAKLRASFYISGLSQSAELGTLVELTLHLSAGREELFRRRVMPYSA